ncbi:U3 small nucleolar RNA-associated protein 14 homolog A [Gadus morhua]|nr:U3 small nucleolar RNA-associated protein 14 homolog A-like [Gadus morhua]
MAKILKKNKVSTKGTKKTLNKNTGTEKTPEKSSSAKRRERKRKTVGKLKGTLKTTKKSPIEKLDLDNVDEDELLNEGEEIIPSEDEGGSDDDRKHQKLLEAISALGGKKKRRLAERSEATIQISEFSVDAKGEGEKINLSDLIQTIAKTPAVSAQTKSHLKKLKLEEKTVDSPLTKPETERIQRNVAFQKSSEEVSRWQSIVKQNLKAEQLVFPLNQEAPGPKPLEQVVCGWKARTPLEQEIFRLLSVNKQPINDPVLTPIEEESLKAMSLEDAKIRRAELQKARALQSYYEAKARRERSIKSKKYHKVQNKAKRKEFVKKFDEMLKSDPVSALEELQKLELGRMKERMSLKHQNSGKWAKSKAIMAKYDDGARKAMQQQLEVNKDLTQKLATTLSDEEGEDDGETSEPDMLPDFVNEVEPGQDPANPWMRGQLSKDPVDLTEPSVPETAAAVLISEDEEEGPEETEEEGLLRGFAERRKQRQEQEAENEAAKNQDMEVMTEENKAGAEKAVASHDAADADIADDDEEEEEELSKFTNLFQELKDSRMEAEASAMVAEVSEPECAQLQQAMFRIKSLEDMDLLDQEEQADPAEPNAEAPQPAPLESKGADKKRKRKRGIDLAEVLTKEATVINVPLAPTAVEGAEGAAHGQEEQRDVIKEAFAGDDVISDFLKDKRREEEAGRPKVVDLTLPGWGEWGGQGLQPSKKKRRRFRLKTAPPPPRKDGGLASVIISEKRDSSVSMHQVGALPHPFLLPEQFEVTMRAPVGATWNTRQAVKKITMPKIVTKVGAIIQPMSRDDLLKHSRKQEEEGTAGEPKKRKAPQRKRSQKRHKKTKN